MKNSKQKTKRRKLICCSLLFALVAANVVVTVSNERQKSLYVTTDAKASWYNPTEDFFNFIENLINDLTPYYRSMDRDDLPCAPFEIFNGTRVKGSDAARTLEAKLGINANTGVGRGTVSINGAYEGNYSSSRSTKTSVLYEYSVSIILPGNNWHGRTCMPENPAHPEAFKNCKSYNECSETISTMAEAYRQALRI